jgi:plastocyanin
VHRGTLAALMLACACRATAGDLTLEVRDAAGRSVTDAVLFAVPSGAPTTDSTAAVTPPARALIDQVDKEFVPRVNIVRAGTEVFFPNSDNIRHSIYSFSPAKIFTTKLYSGREASPVQFDKTGIVVLGCNIHDKMVAWVYVVDTPWFAKSGADGSATLKGLPAGDYRVTAAAPASNLGAMTADVHVDGAPARHSFTLAAP